ACDQRITLDVLRELGVFTRAAVEGKGAFTLVRHSRLVRLAALELVLAAVLDLPAAVDAVLLGFEVAIGQQIERRAADGDIHRTEVSGAIRAGDDIGEAVLTVEACIRRVDERAVGVQGYGAVARRTVDCRGQGGGVEVV